jgi:hypothetical protein
MCSTVKLLIAPCVAEMTAFPVARPRAKPLVGAVSLTVAVAGAVEAQVTELVMFWVVVSE